MKKRSGRNDWLRQIMMDREQVPKPLKRQLRQEAKFGCCVCGDPIGQYHHIIPYADRQEHRTEDMMFVCLRHHDQITKGIISQSEQRAAKQKPYNEIRGLSSGQLTNRQDYVALDVGGGLYLVGDEINIFVYDKPVIRLKRNTIGCVDISIDIYNRNGDIICQIDENEWIYDVGLWDVICDWHRLTIKERSGVINFQLDSNSKPMTLRGSVCLDGIDFTFSEKIMTVELKDGKPFQPMANLAVVGADFSFTHSGTGIMPGRGGAMLVTQESPRERLWAAVKALKTLTDRRTEPT